MAIKKDNQWYIAETLGQIKNEVTNIKEDVVELAKIVESIQKKTYIVIGISIAVGTIANVGIALARYLI